MRWEALFADMEAQLDAAHAQGREHEVADLTRAERSTVALVDRLRRHVGAPVAVTLRHGERVDGSLLDVGATWLLAVSGGREHLVPVAAVASLRGLGSAVAPAESALRRLGLGHAVRAVARDRAVVRVHAAGDVWLGRVDGVGADHLDLSLAYEDSGRPTGESLVVTFAGLDLVSGA